LLLHEPLRGQKRLPICPTLSEQGEIKEMKLINQPKKEKK